MCRRASSVSSCLLVIAVPAFAHQCPSESRQAEEIIKAIRSRNSTIPIIAMTGFAGRGLATGEDSVLALAVELGATCTLEKPLNRPETMRAVISCLGLTSCASKRYHGNETVASP